MSLWEKASPGRTHRELLREMSLGTNLRPAERIRTSRPALLLASAVFLALLSPLNSAAQGCAQCRDNAAAMPPRTQRAYRHAIELLIVTAGTLFAGTVVLLKRNG